MTVLEEYKAEVDSLINRLDNMSFGFIPEDEIIATKLMADASQKLEEMMDIIVNTGAANALQIMLDDLEKIK